MRYEGSIVALITPFEDDGSVDMASLRLLIERQIEAGVDSISVCGTTGEAPTLSEDEERELFEETIHIVDGRCKVILGTGSLSTSEAVKKTREAQRVGADACLVVFPYYNRPSPHGVRKHFEEIAKVGLPMIPYHHPGRTGIRLPAGALLDLLSMEEIVAIKETTCDMELVTQLANGTDKPILSGDDSMTLAHIAVGGKGVVSVIANLIPKEWKELNDLCLQGNFTAAREIYWRFYPLLKAIMSDPNPQGIKCAMSIMGLCKSRLRLPMTEPHENVQEEIRNQMQAAFASLNL
jgi:4-hydroxy-tetrahydrodipicolinate synthase